MASHRMQRLNKDFKREISDILSSMKDARVNEFLSVMRVEVTSDLSYAKVYIGSLKGYEQAVEACGVLRSAEGYIKTALAKSLRIKKVPKLQFVADDAVESYFRIQNILDGLKEQTPLD